MALKYSERQKKKKIVPIGNEKLFNKEEWVPSEEMDCETKVLNHPILHEAFERVVKQHNPVQHTAFLSLCTAVRPYYHSNKYKKFLENFDNKVDIIVVSNGGMIPEPFWESWPFLNYEAGLHEDTNLYKKTMYERMHKFFKENEYKYVIANFIKQQRNYGPAEQSLSELKELGYIQDYILLPSQEVYRKVTAKVAPHKKEDRDPNKKYIGRHFVPYDQLIIDDIVKQIEKYGYDKSKLPRTLFEL